MRIGRLQFYHCRFRHRPKSHLDKMKSIFTTFQGTANQIIKRLINYINFWNYVRFLILSYCLKHGMAECWNIIFKGRLYHWQTRCQHEFFQQTSVPFFSESIIASLMVFQYSNCVSKFPKISSDVGASSLCTKPFLRMRPLIQRRRWGKRQADGPGHWSERSQPWINCKNY